MTRRIKQNKWILYRHTRDLDLVLKVAELLKSMANKNVGKDEKARLQNRLADLGLYNERNPSRPLDAINHKINTLCFFMFGYKERDNNIEKFIFSPLGNLFLKNIGDKKKRKLIFLSMLWAIQFEHPHSGTDSSISLYPFRLIYKLLLDKRLEQKLFAYELSYAVVFTDHINKSSYEELVEKLLSLRELDDDALYRLFLEDSHAYVNSVYEWDYYTSRILESEGVIDIEEGEVIGKIQHGSTNTFRKISRNVCTIPDDLIDFIRKIESEYTYDTEPLALNDPNRPRLDVIKEIYSFYPKILLLELGEYSKEIDQILQLPKLIKEYSRNNDGETAYLFEDALEEGFNQFYNVSAKKIGGAGNADLECVYLEMNKKFSVDAKSTKNKLSMINSGRLRHHREMIGGEYTIVITPEYVPAVLRDIENTKVVILLASTFSEFLYNNLAIDNREIDYGQIDRIIEENLGDDISDEVSNITIGKFGVSSDVLA